MDHGFPRERASGSGDGGPVPRPWPGSAFPEDGEDQPEDGAPPSPAPPASVPGGDGADGPVEAPHWQEPAHAGWLHAYGHRPGRPGAGRAPAPGPAAGPAAATAATGPAQHDPGPARPPHGADPPGLRPRTVLPDAAVLTGGTPLDSPGT